LWLGLLNPLVLWHLVADAHNDGLMLGLVLAGTEIALGGVSRDRAAAFARIGTGVLLITIAANIKIVALAALGCLAAELARQWGGTVRRFIVVALSLLALSTMISFAIGVGTGLGFGWIHAIGASGTVYSWLAPTIQLGFLIGTLGALVGTDLTSAAVAMTTRVGAAIGGVIAVKLLWTTVAGRLHPLRFLALIFAAMLVLGPVVQPWYLLWTVVPFAAVARTIRERQILAAVSAVFAILLPPGVGSAGQLVLAYLVAGLAVVTALLLLRIQRPPRAVVVALSDEAAQPSPVPVLAMTGRTPSG
jgi:alpha-1,6-mannosyltransferase